MTTRRENERNYHHWEELPDGGRRYWKDMPGKIRNWARYIKIVDADENTLSYVQEIYDDENRLIARHQKYPVDTGHQDLVEENSDRDHKTNGSAEDH